MKRILISGCVSLAGVIGLWGQTIPIFINESPFFSPPDTLPTINAVSFVNRSTFSVSTFLTTLPGNGNLGFGGALPYETANTLFFTNESSGVMSASPGFRFMNNRPAQRIRKPADTFVNDGTIDTSTYLEIRATNIINTGPLSSSSAGLIRIVGNDVDVTRTPLRTGQSPFGIFSFDGENDFPRRGQYFNAIGVTDAYWGVGSNGVFLGSGPATRLTDFNFNLPSPRTPLHQNEYLLGRRLATNRVSLPKFSSGQFFFTGTNFVFPTNFAAFVYTNTVDGTAAMVQVVFVRTNSPDGNFSADVKFDPFAFDAEVTGPAQVIVELKRWDFDLALDNFITNTFYLVDSMAIRTNLSLYRSATPRSGTRRPSVYEFLLSPPFNWPNSVFSSGFGAVPANSTFTNGLLDTGYLSNRVEMRYAGYSANVFSNVFSGLTSPVLTPTTTSLAAITPTNLAGRVEIFGDRLNLESTRIRSESTVLIKTKDLTNNILAQVDAPLVGFDLTSTQPELVISNLAPADVHRLSGAICAWSGQWKNYQIDPSTMTTNEINFHVLFVDHNLQPVVPVNVFLFAAHANNLVISDRLSLYPRTNQFGFLPTFDPIRGRKLLIDAESLDVRGGLTFPLSSVWSKSTVQRVVNFTNSGIVFVPGAAKYGTDRADPYNSIVNSGTNTAASQLVRTLTFENSGCFVANSAIAQIDAVSARIEGAPIVIQTNIFPQVAFTNFTLVTNGFITNIFYSSFGAKVQSYSDLQIKAGDLSASNSLLAAGSYNGTFLIPGRLVLDVTNSLVDAGPDARNYWSCSAGFNVRQRPATSSLLGTWLSTAVGVNRQETHIWPAQDLGAVPAGFDNNLALGKLSINISPRNGRAVFRPASGMQAMYVDYIELLNGATNFNSTISINPSMTIYFANANVPASKLDGAAGGRFQWVSSFAGPLSSTNITYPSGNTYTFNIALVTSKDIDSDNDGIVNADDPTPIPVPGEPTFSPAFTPASTGTTDALRLSVALDDSLPPQAKLSWQPRPSTISTIEFKEDWAARDWQVLTNIISGAVSRPVTIYDSIARDGHMRVYRLRVSPAPLR